MNLKYIVYLVKYNGLLSFNIIVWETKYICELRHDWKGKILKRKYLTSRMIDKFRENTNFFVKPESIHWNSMGLGHMTHKECFKLYMNGKQEEMKKILETLEENVISYLYYVYDRT